MTQAFFTLHRDLPREGPGTAEDVRWALSIVGRPARVIDAACGPGADTVTLAEELPEARIEAVDRTTHFVAEARTRVARFGGRVSVREGDMRELTGPADLIWCAGALYFLGIETALPLWRRALAPGGKVAFSEPVFVTDPPSEAARAFWADYPGVGGAASIARRVEEAEYRAVATRTLTGQPWADYYLPMEARIERLRPGASGALAQVLDAAEREIALWRAAPDEVAYLLAVTEPA
ncbi:Trans-aconitate 2-methyltransferase [Defluviimonas aquaemixtae]|uniref:Trans-aconitate 2-methyltransferase n=1 Tax=Albidovulum aquaemixtae TaxID=1542388 RepID=A0A2R8B567_9RHOB|nr:class I SAM-dependent methyltransferase [Defluviimonas aquaemixtae]SPH17748.1 Trans-aconitate 2-methyltransferase [Defluviimonas aquaemixtae]